jgi:maleylpyruvate isomerase
MVGRSGRDIPILPDSSALRSPMFRLYSYFRSSASYRVRIALALKGLAYEYIPIHLLKGGGEQFGSAYRELNPAALTPTLVLDHGAALSQSLAIIEYLDETHPLPRLLPKDPIDRAYVRTIALQIACEMHPLNNLRVLRYLKDTLNVNEDQKSAWYAHWIALGFEAIEHTLVSDPRTDKFCCGNEVTLADICLVPQVFNAKRMGVPLEGFPTILRINESLSELEAFARAEPSAQPDAC